MIPSATPAANATPRQSCSNGTTDWREVNAASPCLICGKADWCARDAAGTVALCRRVDRHPIHGPGNAKRDKGGADYWTYRLTPAAPRPDRWPAPQCDVADGRGELADADTLHRAYSRLLELSSLNAAHRDALRKRGIDPAALRKRGYASLDAKRAGIVQKLIRDGMEELLPCVPGFRVREKNGGRYWSFGGRGGLLVPVRDPKGRIVGILTRPDAGGAKYVWCSSKRDGGPGPGAPIHVPTFAGAHAMVRVTEGALKADVATELSGILTIGLSGVGTWRRAASVLREVGATTARVALDADARTNPAVARALAGLAELLPQRGFALEVEMWDIADGKGVDDVLAAGKQPDVVTGDAAGRAVTEIVKAAEKTAGAASVAAAAALENDDDPHRLARLHLDGHRDADGRMLLRWWKDEFWRWRSGAHRPIPAGELRGRLVRTIKHEFDRANRERLAEWQQRRSDKGDNDGNDGPPKVQRVTTQIVTNTVQALTSLTLLPGDTEPPAWLNDGGPAPAELVICRNAVIHLPALVAGAAGTVRPPTPDLFALSAAEIDFDRDAVEPTEWLRFLSTLWPDDAESRTTLCEWFGYLLTPDTSQQKMLLMVGPPRSGKGTIGRVLTALLGRGNVAGPTLGSLGTNFGLWPLVGKPCAIISDARLTGRNDLAAIAERLLSISGEDVQTVDRKYLPPVSMRLPTRFLILTNELPRIADASGALAGRFVMLRLTESFCGREDTGLEQRLLAELPGVFLWAVAGWQRLRQRGRFQQPASALSDVQELADLASPVKTFIRDCCTVGSGLSVKVQDLYAAWKDWCERNGKRESGDVARFGRDLRAACASVAAVRLREGDERSRAYRGIALAGG